MVDHWWTTVVNIWNRPHDQCFFRGPESLFLANMCKAQKGNSVTIAKNAEGNGSVETVVLMVY